jgi:proteasome accessory factor B
MPDTLPPAERLLNLVIALVNTPGRMTKEQIRSSVAGYDREGSGDAFERMFERDKETLRDLGVPVITVSSAAHGDDQGYRIDVDAYALPPMELSAAQLGVLTLAAELWQDQTLRSDAARALTKLRAVGTTAAATDAVAGLAPRLHPAGPALVPLLDATQARQMVTFTYRAASTSEVLVRRVQPWRLIASGGGWYLVGLDIDRHAPRVFRLSRIVGEVTTAGPTDAFTVPDGVDPTALVASQHSGDRIAWLAIAPDRAGALRSRSVPTEGTGEHAPAHLDAPPGMDVLAVPYARTTDLADEITAYTDAVVVLGPAALREAVVRRLLEAVVMGDRLGDRPPGGDHGTDT